MSGAAHGGALERLESRQAKLHEELANVEKQLYDLETQYLSASAECGSVLRGFESYLTASTKSGSHAKRQGTRHFKPEERLFSLSSTTSPAGEVDDTLQ